MNGKNDNYDFHYNNNNSVPNHTKNYHHNNNQFGFEDYNNAVYPIIIQSKAK